MKKKTYKKIFNLIFKIVPCIPILIMNIFLFYFFYTSTEFVTKIILAPFCLCTLFILFAFISYILNNEGLGEILIKAFVGVFLTFWFGVLIYFVITFDYLAARLFSIPFWLTGFSILYKVFLSKK